MKKKNMVALILIFIMIITSNINAYATVQKGRVSSTTGLKLRKDAGTTYSKITTLAHNTIVDVLNSKKTTDKSTGCGSGTWYYVKAGNTQGYACSDFIEITDTGETTPGEMSKLTEKEFEEYLKRQEFPSSYRDKLKVLHKAHPNWVFKGVKSKYTWSNTLDQESYKGRSLYQVTSTGVKNGLQGYLNTGSDYYNYETDTFKAYDGSTWYQANNQTISYYMDPRNFLTETGIFMFEDLTYYKSYQTDKVVKKILYTDFYSDLIKYYIEGAEKSNVSPVYLAALSRQEVGLNSSTATSGKAGTYNGVNYNGYYNFYNIGASSGKNPVYNGLKFSKEKGWNTQQKAIVGGAEWIVHGYISKGQYTRYFQKWNVSPTTSTGIWHQYMTDIKALVSPSITTSASYNSMGIINEEIVFSIPIYIGMPTSTSLPSTGNPNNWLKDLKVEGKTVQSFKGSTTNYNLGTTKLSSIKIDTTTVNKNASVDGDGTVSLNVGTNKINIIVTAQNGAKKTYTLNITRERKITPTPDPEPEKEEITVTKILSNLSIKNTNDLVYGFALGTTSTDITKKILNQNPNSIVKITNNNGKAKTTNALSTGDKISITSNKETKTYYIVIYGDLNGDAKINAKDLLALRKYLLNEQKLNGPYLKAASITRNSKVTAKDLLALRKYLLGEEKISQL